jgi:tetratricopeptide (TPR) repeat protein
VIPELLAELLVDGAIYLWERGLLAQAHQLITSAKSICEDGEYNPQLLSGVYSFQGCILSDSGDLEQARLCFTQEVYHKRWHLKDLQRKNKKPDMIDEIQLANAYNNLAGILCANGDFKEAELNNQLSLYLKERWKHKGDLDYLLSLSYNNFANVFGLQGRWDEAALWYQKALSIPEEKHYTPRRALVYHNFGCMRLNQGHLQEALEYLTEAVQLRIEKLGDHYDTANSLHILATCYRKEGKLLEARDLLKEALRMLDSQHLRDPRRIARTEFLLSLVLEDLGDPKASQLRQDARKIREQVTGKAASGSEKEEDYDDLVPYI